MRSRFLLGVLGWVASCQAIGCYAETCDESFADYALSNTDDNELRYRAIVSGDTWESSAIDDAWLPFPPHRTMRLHLTEFLNGKAPVNLTAFISPFKSPNRTPNTNFTQAAGNVAVFSAVDKEGVTIENATCTPYYVRVIVTRSPSQ